MHWVVKKYKYKGKLTMKKFNYEYSTVSKDCEVEGCKYTGYGIAVKEKGFGVLRVFSDISRSRRDIDDVVEKCNRLELDPIHIEDVVEDLLAH